MATEPPSNSTPTALIATHHSENFYFEDGSAVICAVSEDRMARTLYRLHPSLLGKRSAMLKCMFTMGVKSAESDAQAPKVEDGYDDAHPILLPHPKFTSRKFDHLLIYLFTGPSNYPSAILFLLDVLDMSDFLDIPDGVSYATKALEDHPSFNATLQFKLAREYSIIRWVEPSIQEMMKRPGSEFTQEDAENLGFDAFYLIVMTKFRVDELRKGMAYNPPPLSMGPSCRRFEKCIAVWEDVWWSGLAQHILHPDWSTAGERVRKELELARIEGVCTGCQIETLVWMDEKNLFRQDADLINECVVQLKDLCGDRSSESHSIS